jgi:hypothetical protein
MKRVTTEPRKPAFFAEIHLEMAHANLVALLDRNPSDAVTRDIAAYWLIESRVLGDTWSPDDAREWLLNKEQCAALEAALASAITVAATSSTPQAPIPKSLALDLADVLEFTEERYGPDHVFTHDIRQQLSAIADGAGTTAMRRMYKLREKSLNEGGFPLDWHERQAVYG